MKETGVELKYKRQTRALPASAVSFGEKNRSTETKKRDEERPRERKIQTMNFH